MSGTQPGWVGPGLPVVPVSTGHSRTAPGVDFYPPFGALAVGRGLILILHRNWMICAPGCRRARGFKDSAKPAVHFVHEGWGSCPTAGSRSVLSRVISAVTLTTESLGSPLAIAGTKTLPGIAARPVFDVMTAGRRRPGGPARGACGSRSTGGSRPRTGKTSPRRWSGSGSRPGALVRGHRRIVAEFFDIGESRSVAWARRPQAAALVTQLADPDHGNLPSRDLSPT